MAKYTIEDIEILRQKSGISYEEAVNLLEYHNGSLARALVDLEKNGRLKNDGAQNVRHKGLKGLFDFLFRLRLKVKKDKMTIVNLSSLFMLLVLGTAPHVCVIGLIVSLVLGYRISIDRDCADFAGDSFDAIVKNARTNVQNTVDGFAQQFSGEHAKDGNSAHAGEGDFSQQRSETAASGTRPVNVQFPDGGSVNVRDGGDGYHEADIR